jgi:uncharacterized protein (TIGR02145 family)
MSRLFIFILLITSFLSAQDERKLKDGTIIKGEKVDRVGGVYNIELDSGKSIIGQIVFEDTKLIRLVAGSKPVELYWKNIRNITEAENKDDGSYHINDNSGRLVINRSGEEHIAPGEPIRDIDGNEYQTVEIGPQTWMAENLRVRRYKHDQSFIPSHGLTPRAEYLYTNNPDIPGDIPISSVEAYDDDWDNVDTYGLLYTGWKIENSSGTGGVCPDGWDVPTRADFEQLFFYLGGIGIDSQSEDINESHVNSRLAGNRELWLEWGGGTNYMPVSERFVNLLESPKFGDTGFNALPSGFRRHVLWDRYYAIGGDYVQMGHGGASFWTQTIYGSDDSGNEINESYFLNPTPEAVPNYIIRHIFQLTSKANASNVYYYSHINAGRAIRCIMEE